MLILTRRIGEAINIGDNISVRVLDVHGSQARIGIKAPKEVAMHREEVFYRIKQQDSESITEAHAYYSDR